MAAVMVVVLVVVPVVVLVVVPVVVLVVVLVMIPSYQHLLYFFCLILLHWVCCRCGAWFCGAVWFACLSQRFQTISFLDPRRSSVAPILKCTRDRDVCHVRCQYKNHTTVYQFKGRRVFRFQRIYNGGKSIGQRNVHH